MPHSRSSAVPDLRWSWRTNPGDNGKENGNYYIRLYWVWGLGLRIAYCGWQGMNRGIEKKLKLVESIEYQTRTTTRINCFSPS